MPPEKRFLISSLAPDYITGSRMRLRCLVLIMVTGGLLGAAEQDPSAPDSLRSQEAETVLAYRQAFELFKSSNFEDSRRWLEEARKCLPASRKPPRWVISDLMQLGVYCSSDTIYTVGLSKAGGFSFSDNADAAKKLQEERAQIKAMPKLLIHNGESQGMWGYVSAYNAQTGHLKWRVQAERNFHIYISEKLNLVLLNKGCLFASVEASTGRVLEQCILDAGPESNKINAFLAKGCLLPSQFASEDPDSTWLPDPPLPHESKYIYDLDTKTLQVGKGHSFLDLPISHMQFTEVFRDSVVVDGVKGSGIVCRLADRVAPFNIWQHRCPSGRYPPFWYEGDVLAMNGDTRGEVVRLDGDTGKILWSYSMGEATGQALSGIGEATEAQTPLWILDGNVAALDARGRLHLIDPATGTLRRRIAIGRRLSGRPSKAGDLIILPTKDRIVGIPMGTFLGDSEASSADIDLLEAHIRMATGQLDEALQLVKQVVTDVPWKENAWLLLGYLQYSLGQVHDGYTALIRYLEMTDMEDIELSWDRDGRVLPKGIKAHILKDCFGLVRRIPIGGELDLPLVEVNGLITAITKTGRVATIDPLTFKCCTNAIHSYPQQAVNPRTYLNFEVMRANGRDIIPVLVHQTNIIVTSLSGEQWNMQSSRPHSVKKKSHRHLINEMPSAHIELNGIRYTLSINGKVRVYAPSGDFQDYETHLSGVGYWSIRLVNGIPIAVSNNGILLLDEHLCPAERVLEGRWVVDMSGDGRTIAVVIGTSTNWQDRSGCEFLILDPANYEVISETGVDDSSLAHLMETRANLLQPCNGGYLLAGQQLTWLPTRKNGAPVCAGWSSRAVINTAQRGPAFNSFLVRDDFVFVGSEDGYVYVLDVDAVARLSSATKTQRQAPLVLSEAPEMRLLWD
jgi:outer membrane protein assembly factor BamB